MARGGSEHVTTLNLFREKDGSYWITVSGSNDVQRLLELKPEATNPMQALALMVEEAGPRFVESWKDWERGQ